MIMLSPFDDVFAIPIVTVANTISDPYFHELSMQILKMHTFMLFKSIYSCSILIYNVDAVAIFVTHCLYLYDV